MRPTLFALIHLLFIAGCAPSASNRPPRSAEPPGLTSEMVKGLGPPQVVVTNNSQDTIVVDFVGPTTVRLSVAPLSTQTTVLAAGTYTLQISGPEGFPDVNTATLLADHRYGLGVTSSLEVDDPRFAGLGFHCYEVLLAPNFLNCTRRAEDCPAARAAKAKIPTAACAYEKSVYFIRIRPAVNERLQIMFMRDAAQCEIVRNYEMSRRPLAGFGPCERRP